MKKTPKKQLPTLNNDREAEKFVATADLAQYDLSAFRPVHFEFLKKEGRINMRLPESLLSAVRKRAAEQGMPYQRFIRDVLEKAVQERH
jgi:predicted DNA binding CopG/RHH family protein